LQINLVMKTNVFLIALFLMFFVYAKAQESLMIGTETRFWDKSGAYNGYTLFAGSGKTYLVDMEGHVIKSWNIGTNPRLSENGTIIDATKADPSGYSGWQELDWNGNVIWSYTETRTGYSPHHDFKKIYNKKLGAFTFIYIANKTVTQQQCLDAGCNPANSNLYKTAQMDAIVEVDLTGKVVWEWWFFDHVVQDIDLTKSTYGVVANSPGKIDLNLPGRPVKSDWLHCNSLDYNEELDQIVTNSVQGEFYVIDHGNTFIANNPTESIKLAASSAGDFLYRFGDPARYDQGNPPSILEDWTSSTAGHKQIGGAHDIQWIRPGLPGAGNFLIFNNGEYLFEHTPQSYIFEINPFLNSAGTTTSNYINPPDAGYAKVTATNKDQMKQTKNQSKQIIWTYSSKNSVNFYSTIGSSAQRLPNGNTFICAMNSGHFFEVTSSGTIVWEYINPMTRDGIKKIITDNFPTYNAAFRAYRYAADYPGLSGRDLTPGKTITGFDPDYYVPADLTASLPTSNALVPSGNQQDPTLKNYPNPFSMATTILYTLEDNHQVQLTIYNQSGQMVKELIDQHQNPGNYSVNWDATSKNGSKVTNGLYYYVLKLDNNIQSKKMIYMK
jgi:hypothetical protein